jgi:SAM-dependent methyltransferase
MTDVTAPKEFWERKILNWEKLRYSHWLALYPLSWSVRARLRKACKVIARRADAKWTVLELACGSGLLAQKLRGRIAGYRGLDIAQNAIARARQRVPEFEFNSADVLTTDFAVADLTVFLGLTDWLDERGLDAVFAKLNSPRVLFSYTQVSQWNPYRLYRVFMDKPMKSGTQRARTFNENQIRGLLERHGYRMSRLTRPYLLNPGVLVWAEKQS